MPDPALIAAVALTALYILLGFAALWAFRRWPGRPRAAGRNTGGRLPADFDYAKDDPRDADTSRGPDHRR